MIYFYIVAGTYIWGVIVGWLSCEAYERWLAPKAFNNFKPRSKRRRLLFALVFNFFAPVMLCLHTVLGAMRQDVKKCSQKQY